MKSHSIGVGPDNSNVIKNVKTLEELHKKIKDKKQVQELELALLEALLKKCTDNLRTLGGVKKNMIQMLLKNGVSLPKIRKALNTPDYKLALTYSSKK